jgi:hypothetical protein
VLLAFEAKAPSTIILFKASRFRDYSLTSCNRWIGQSKGHGNQAQRRQQSIVADHVAPTQEAVFRDIWQNQSTSSAKPGERQS